MRARALSPLTPPYIRITYTAVHELHWNSSILSKNDTRPYSSKYFFGKALFICDAPEFHHGPLPLPADKHAFISGMPLPISFLARVRGLFH